MCLKYFFYYFNKTTDKKIVIFVLCMRARLDSFDRRGLFSSNQLETQQKCTSFNLLKLFIYKNLKVIIYHGYHFTRGKNLTNLGKFILNIVLEKDGASL